MKKTILLVLAALMLVGLLASCAEKQYLNIIDGVRLDDPQDGYNTVMYEVGGMTWNQLVSASDGVLSITGTGLSCKFSGQVAFPVYYYRGDPGAYTYTAADLVVIEDADGVIIGSPTFICRCILN